VLPPYTSGVPPAAGTVGGVSYTWVLGNGNYMDTTANGVSFKNGDNILVNGSARIYVTGNFSMQGNSSITIAPGARLELYVGGASTTIGIVNNQGNCASFNYFGLPDNTS